jgi:hypothetical protein
MDTLVVFPFYFPNRISSLQLAVSAIQSSAQSWKKLLQTIKNNFFIQIFNGRTEKASVIDQTQRRHFFSLENRRKISHFTT